MFHYVSPPLNYGRGRNLRESFMSKCIKKMENNAPENFTKVTFQSLRRTKNCCQKYVLALVTNVLSIEKYNKRHLHLRAVTLNDSGDLEDNTAASKLELVGDYAQLSQCIDKGDLLMLFEFKVSLVSGRKKGKTHTCPMTFIASSELQLDFRLYFMPIEEERVKQLGIDKNDSAQCSKLIRYMQQFGLELTDDNHVYAINEVVTSSWGKEYPVWPSEVELMPVTNIPPRDHCNVDELSEKEMPTKRKKKGIPASDLAKIQERKSERLDKQKKGVSACVLAKIQERKLRSLDKRKRQKTEERPANITPSISAGTVTRSSEITGARNSSINKSVIPSPTLSSKATTDGVSTSAPSLTVPISATSLSVANAPLSAIAPTNPSANLATSVSVTASTGVSADSATSNDGKRAIDERLMSIFDESVSNLTIVRNSLEAFIKNTPRVSANPTSKSFSHSFINIKDIVPGYFDIECEVLAVYLNKDNPSHAIMMVWDGTKPPKPCRMPLLRNYSLKFKDLELSKIEDHVVAINIFDTHVSQLDKLKVYEIVRIVNVRAKFSMASMLLDLNGGGRHFKRGINPMTAGSDWSRRLEERTKTTRSAIILRTLVEWCSSKTGIEKSSKKMIPGQNDSVNINNNEVDLHDAVENCNYIIRLLTQTREECVVISESSSRMNPEYIQLTAVQKNSILKSPCNAVLDHSIKTEAERVLVPFYCIEELARNIISSFQMDQGRSKSDDTENILHSEDAPINNEEGRCQESCGAEKVSEDCVLVSTQDKQSEDTITIHVENIQSLYNVADDVDELWKNIPNDAETCQQSEGSRIEIDETPQNKLLDDQPANFQVYRRDELLTINIESMCETKNDGPGKRETEDILDHSDSVNEQPLVEKSSTSLKVHFAGRKSVKCLKRHFVDSEEGPASKRMNKSSTVVSSDQTQYKDSNEENSSVVDSETYRSQMNKSDDDIFCKLNLKRISDYTAADLQDRFYSIKELTSAVDNKKYQFRGAIVDIFPRSDDVKTAFKLKCKLCQTKFPLTVDRSPPCKVLDEQGVQLECDLTPTVSFKMRLCDPYLSTIDVIVCDEKAEAFFWGYRADTLQKPENLQLLSVTIGQLCPYPTYLNCHSSILHCKLMPVVDEKKTRRLYVVDTVLKCLCEFQNGVKQQLS